MNSDIFAAPESKLPTGRVDVPDTLVWPAIYGGYLEGTGGILDNSEHQPNRGTRIVHKGDKSKPTLVYHGYGGSIDRVTFTGDGRLRDCPKEDRAANGIVVDKQENPPSGFGTGKLFLRDVSFTNYARAIQLGLLEAGQDHTTEHNSDQLMIGRVQTTQCDTLLRVEHEQGLDVNVLQARPYITHTAFDFEGGGNLNCQFLLLMYGLERILRTGSRVGSNSGAFSIGKGGRIVIDTNQKVPIFVEQGKRCASCEFAFHNVRIGNGSQWPTEPIFRLLGGSSLKLDGFKSLKTGMIRFTNSIIEKYKNHVILNDVITSAESPEQLFSPDSKGECWVTVGSVRSGFGVPRFKPGLYKVAGSGSGVTLEESPESLEIANDVADALSQIGSVENRLQSVSRLADSVAAQLRG